MLYDRILYLLSMQTHELKKKNSSKTNVSPSDGHRPWIVVITGNIFVVICIFLFCLSTMNLDYSCFLWKADKCNIVERFLRQTNCSLFRKSL